MGWQFQKKRVKKKGVVGRSSREMIERRHEIEREVLKENNYALTKQEFAKKTKKKLAEDPMFNGATNSIPTSTTLYKDLEVLGIGLGKQSNKASYICDELIPLYNTIYSHIREIRIDMDGSFYVLYPHEKTIPSNAIAYSFFWEQIQKEAEEFNLDYSDDLLVHVYIIFFNRGYEELTCMIFEQIFSDILYTTYHRYAAEIAIHYGDLEEFLKYVCELIPADLHETI